MSLPYGNQNAKSNFQLILCNTKLRSLILTAGLLSVTGCDPVRTITHSVTIAVVDHAGLPSPDVELRMKESWHSWGGGVKEVDKDYYRNEWESNFVPWLKAVTNVEGKAVITIKITTLDRSRGNEPPPKRDTVSNREYIIKLNGPKAEDELNLVLKSGASIKGKSYTVTVVDIQKPRYISSPKD